ncbi:hypothetical protein [Peribacillus simplex]|uniref:Phage infection protein n=1 Tax=Peribacillus simplex NBRC 15720 = DSM 1321 TaxID=1349754 RepID=A0A223EL57_9BACI|nr:hypothetical protein [Peribacillus simplex]ASS95982.1 hypothetical protein BS1321_19970 [Peribacillus simplex NBRC 15720 = DSM 1321]MEC1396432.1 hypothetical protein [Peribacillus simplex]
MDKIKVEIKNCYGINNLENEFDFTAGKSTQIIYAPNGVMKTSFANIFDDYSKGTESKDLIFPMKESHRVIKNNAEEDINPESIFVIKPYEKSFKSNRMSTLLVKEELRRQYDEIHEKIDIEKDKLIEILKSSTGLRSNIEEAICNSFGSNLNSFLQILSQLEDWIKDDSELPYSHIIYNKIFNDKVVAFLETGDIKSQIIEYIKKYEELINKSSFLKKSFNHYNATTVHKNLKDNGFFQVGHSINLNVDGEKQEITDQNKFLKLIKDAKEEILNDDTLQTIFNDIDRKISNAQLREFRDYLFDHQEILTELADLSIFKQKLWISYLKDNKDVYDNLLIEYKKGQDGIKKILEKAKNGETDWENVIEIFNRRFFVPYRLGIKNKEDSVLKDIAPSVDYYYKDRSENIDEDLLLKVLSQGERRTLYLLNIIFEIESRKKQGIKTLFIVDDIADSFDYKNKYAIIEYLKEVSEHDDFFTIILTHNFDFFRTVQERISGSSKYAGSFMAVKENDYIKLENLKYRYISNPLKDWKQNLSDNAKLVASVTFARNIAEYIGDDENFNKLTSILHLKEATKALKIKDLQEIYKSIFRDLGDIELDNSDRRLYDIIFEVADQIISSNSESVANLENKVVLSIAIRLNAELYMINMINDNQFISTINKNQTGKLFGEFRKRFPGELSSIGVLEKVNIMTPENIHLNSFMFEPILDISDHHLQQLYKDVLRLLEEAKVTEVLKEVASAQQ